MTEQAEALKAELQKRQDISQWSEGHLRGRLFQIEMFAMSLDFKTIEKDLDNFRTAARVAERMKR